jgi:hypothetical protein
MLDFFFGPGREDELAGRAMKDEFLVDGMQKYDYACGCPGSIGHVHLFLGRRIARCDDLHLIIVTDPHSAERPAVTQLLGHDTRSGTALDPSDGNDRRQLLRQRLAVLGSQIHRDGSERDRVKGGRSVHNRLGYGRCRQCEKKPHSDERSVRAAVHTSSSEGFWQLQRSGQSRAYCQPWFNSTKAKTEVSITRAFSPPSRRVIDGEEGGDSIFTR